MKRRFCAYSGGDLRLHGVSGAGDADRARPAGYSLGRSDLMRRAMAKKKRDVMAKEREYFINGMTDEAGNVVIDGAVRRGVRRDGGGEDFR